MASTGVMQHSFMPQNMLNNMVPDWLSTEVTTGTTIMAVEFDGGVVIAADSRTSAGTYIPNRVTDKLTKVTENIYCCRSGSSADTQAIADIVNYHINFHRMEMGEDSLVKTAAKVFQDLCYNYRDSLSAGIICAGWDRKLGGQVYSIPLGGMCIRQPVTIGGSGSTYLYGHVDATFKENMTKDECLKFCKDAVSLAIMRDGSSGGVIRMAAITEEGVDKHLILHEDITKFYLE